MLKVDSINFKSRINPIPVMFIKTPMGKLRLAEATAKDYRQKDFFKNLTKFFCNNFASTTNDPNWQLFNKSINLQEYEQSLKNLTKYYKGRIFNADENFTLLLAKDKRNKIQGACMSFGLDIIPMMQKNVCNIESLAVNKQYRGYKVGSYMVDKIIESAKKTFDTIFLTGDLSAVEFYKKKGFKCLDKEDLKQKILVDYLSQKRADYPEYVDFFSKSFNNGDETWIDKAIANINKEQQVLK